MQLLLAILAAGTCDTLALLLTGFLVVAITDSLAVLASFQAIAFGCSAAAVPWNWRALSSRAAPEWGDAAAGRAAAVSGAEGSCAAGSPAQRCVEVLRCCHRSFIRASSNRVNAYGLQTLTAVRWQLWTVCFSSALKQSKAMDPAGQFNALFSAVAAAAAGRV